MIVLQPVKRTDSLLLKYMAVHYSAPKGFVGRNICYAITYAGKNYGYIVGGSATLHLIGRDKLLNGIPLNNIVNNIFYHAVPIDKKYPLRNFTTKVLALWREQIRKDWQNKYGDEVKGFETLVELPRTGECYRRDGWINVGQTKGYTCKRVAGKGTDSWTGKRIWDTKNLRPKHVFIFPLRKELSYAETTVDEETGC
jgi:hypothetical protein